MATASLADCVPARTMREADRLGRARAAAARTGVVAAAAPLRSATPTELLARLAAAGAPRASRGARCGPGFWQAPARLSSPASNARPCLRKKYLPVFHMALAAPSGARHRACMRALHVYGTRTCSVLG